VLSENLAVSDRTPLERLSREKTHKVGTDFVREFLCYFELHFRVAGIDLNNSVNGSVDLVPAVILRTSLIQTAPPFGCSFKDFLAALSLAKNRTPICSPAIRTS
jgi:hypothetical protein